MVCWIANDTRLFRANCIPTDRVISNWNRCSHIHLPIYLLHWNMDQKTEIRSYIKCRIRLNIDSKQIFNELCGIYGPQTISMRTVFRWVKAFFKAGKFSFEDDTRPGRPKTSVTKANIAAVKNVVEQNTRLSVKDIAKCTGKADGSVQTILKSVWIRERIALGGYLIRSLRSKRNNALNVPGNFWKRTKAVIVGLFLTC